jgi:hypothetical protein
MTFIQRFFTAVLPSAWAEEMRAESLSWMIRCTCGFERSIWEIGGIRWKAKGNPRKLTVCSRCGERTWHTIYQKSSSP